MTMDGNVAQVLVALITAIGGYFGGYRHGRKKFRKKDAILDARIGELERGTPPKGGPCE